MGDSSLVEMIVVRVSPYLREDRPLLWLCEKDSGHPRLFPIAIGEFEAAAIQMPLEGEDPIRPISYDLLSSMLKTLGVEVLQVVIRTVRKSIYYARVVIERDHHVAEVDARPSDAVALALRTGAPILVGSELLDQASLVPLEHEGDIEHTLERFHEHEPQVIPQHGQAEPTPVPEAAAQTQAPRPREARVAPDDALSTLQNRLQQAVICEEYEEAARLRDEIESLENDGQD